jgi:hypothetical protein
MQSIYNFINYIFLLLSIREENIVGKQILRDENEHLPNISFKRYKGDSEKSIMKAHQQLADIKKDLEDKIDGIYYKMNSIDNDYRDFMKNNFGSFSRSGNIYICSEKDAIIAMNFLFDNGYVDQTYKDFKFIRGEFKDNFYINFISHSNKKWFSININTNQFNTYEVKGNKIICIEDDYDDDGKYLGEKSR